MKNAIHSYMKCAAWLWACLLSLGVQAQKAKITAIADGYTGKIIDFEFADMPQNNRQFAYAEGKKMEIEVELDEPSLLKVNLWLWMIVSPGDTINANIHYNGKNLQTVEFSGSPAAVLLNETILKGRNERIADRYKTNPLAAVATQIPVHAYCETTLRNWNKEKESLKKIRTQVSPFAFNYIYAELEGMYLSNLTKYPHIVSDITKSKVETVPEYYWTIFDNYKIKDDKASLKSFSYVGWLLDYKEYADRREAHKANQAYHPETDQEKAYESLAHFYAGEVRDAVLYAFLYNAIASQSDFDLAKRLCKDYFKKYNKNKTYRTELSEMLK